MSHVDTATAPPDQLLMHLLSGMWSTRAITVAVQLGIPDIVHGGPASAAEIAKHVAAEPGPVLRLARALASIGVLSAVGDQFGPTPLSERLLHARGTLRNMFIAEGDAVHWRSWERLADAVRTGRPQPAAAVGVSVFDYYNQHRADGEQFGRAMQDVSAMVAHAVLEHYDFSGARTIVDVGGGNGSMLAAVLQQHRTASGIVYDLSYIGDLARRHIESGGLSSRCRFEAGDFFKSVPAGDLYLLKFILHDWDDADCVRILERCRAATETGSRIVVIEMLVPDDNSSPMVALMDLNMLVMTGGRERTAAQYGALLERAGFRPSRVVATGTPFFLIEATAE